MTSRILIIDDEPSVRSLLERVLRRENFDVLSATGGQEGLEASLREKPDLIILDLNLPDLNGEDICQMIRRNPAIQATPVLILTGRTTRGLSARCLEGGADDYLPKPFDIEDLVAHVRALFRRPRFYVPHDSIIEKGRLSIRLSERRVFWDNKPTQNLSPKEFELLSCLLSQAPSVVPKQSLVFKAWGTPLEGLHQRTLDVHIRRIRQKLGPKAAQCLKTVPAVGYQWLETDSRLAKT